MFKKLFSSFNKKSGDQNKPQKIGMNSSVEKSLGSDKGDNNFSFSEEEIQRYINKEVHFRLNRNEEIDFNSDQFDPLFKESAYLIVNHQQASASFLQRKLYLGYNKAGKIIDQLESAGIIGAFDGVIAREVKITSEYQLDLLFQKVHFEDKKHQFFTETMLSNYEDNVIEELNNIREKRKVEEKELMKNNLRKEILEKEKQKKESETLKTLKEEVKRELIEEGKILYDSELKREPIPQVILDKVWNRDGGKCVKCGSQEKIEFDHIIPFAKGGSNTYRNIQILCEKCNRRKSDKIG